MKQTKSQPINETTWRKTGEKTLPIAKHLSAFTGLVKSNVPVLNCNNDNKNCINGSKIPRPKASEWSPGDETSSGDPCKSKLNKGSGPFLSSSTSKRCGNDRIKLEGSEEIQNDNLTFQDNISQASQKTWSIPVRKNCGEAEYSKIGSNPHHAGVVTGRQNSQEPRECTRTEFRHDEAILTKETEADKATGGDQQRAEKSRGCFSRGRKVGPEGRGRGRRESGDRGAEGNRDSDQELDLRAKYELTLKEISCTWKDATELLTRVKNHQEKLSEDGAKTVDKEQLALETEMLELAIDFAMSYSKLKTDSLIKFARKTVDSGQESSKTDLEVFMDSKLFAGSYSEEDVAEMARTVRDLKTSVLQGDEPQSTS